MPDFTQYTREDFLTDESFVNYLLQRDEQDVHFWTNWIKENPQSSLEVREAQSLFFLLRTQTTLQHNSSLRDKIEQQYAKLEPLLHENKQPANTDIFSFGEEKLIKKRSVFTKMIWRSVAAAAILVVAFFVWNNFELAGNNKTKNNLISFAKTGNAGKTIILPDGSRLILNNYSSIAIAKDFNHTKRKVFLTGAAFFKVFKDHSRPFIVSCGDIKTTAVGTAFYIYDRAPQSISVSLLEGAVKVEGEKNNVILQPGEKATSNVGNIIIKDAFNRTQLLNFINGKIEFQHADFTEIKTVLEEYFNIEILSEGVIPRINFTGSFESKKIETILEALKFTYNIDYDVHGQQVTMSFK